MQQLVLVQYRGRDVYRVTKVVNTTEWDIGTNLNRKEVNQILERRGSNKVKVVIK